MLWQEVVMAWFQTHHFPGEMQENLENLSVTDSLLAGIETMDLMMTKQPDCDIQWALSIIRSTE